MTDEPKVPPYARTLIKPDWAPNPNPRKRKRRLAKLARRKNRR
jgi:hypothetical protein